MSDETEQPRELTTTTGTAEIGSTIGVSEAAARLGKSEKTVRRLLAKNELAGAVKTPSATGDTWQIPVAAIDSYLATQADTPRASATTATATRLQELEREIVELRHQVQLRDMQLVERERYLATLEALAGRMLPTGHVGSDKRKRWWRK
jgi:excisionase family DNA binding protein